MTAAELLEKILFRLGSAHYKGPGGAVNGDGGACPPAGGSAVAWTLDGAFWVDGAGVDPAVVRRAKEALWRQFDTRDLAAVNRLPEDELLLGLSAAIDRLQVGR